MALVFMEGFDHREPLGRAVTYNGAMSYVAGRVGGYAVQPATAAAARVDVVLPGTSSTYWASFAFKRVGANVINQHAFAFLDPTANLHGSVRLETSGALTILNNANAIMATSTATVSPTGWNRIDIKITKADAGMIECYLNGNLVVSAAGDYNYFSSTALGLFRIEMQNSSGGIAVDDVYITDTTGPAPYNGRLPDLRIETITPAADGSASQLLGSDGNRLANWDLVDETPTSTTDYVTSATPGERDLYTFSDLATLSGQVWGVQVHANASKTDAGAATLAPVTKVAGVERKDTALGLSTSPNWVSGAIQTLDPSDAAWTVAKVNAAEFGIEVG